MYKQRCAGTAGPLMPVIFICACGLILYSATDAGVRALGWQPWVFAVSACIFALTTLLIYRYTRVEMEYVWFSGEFVVRRYESGRIIRFSLNKQNFCGIRDRMGSLGFCRAARTKNCCASLRGRLRCMSLYYHDEQGHSYRVLIQPNAELRELLWAATKDSLVDVYGLQQDAKR